MPLITRWDQKISPLLRSLYHNNETQNGLYPIIIETVPGREERTAALVDDLQGKVRKELQLIPALVVDIPATALSDLAKSSNILRVWHDSKIAAALDKVISRTGSAVVQDLGYKGRGVVIAVFDTGIFPHDDLTTPENRILAWNDIIHHQNYVYDDNGHGTAVAGIIAGNGSSSEGKYIGMAPEARLVGVKIWINQELGGSPI